MPGFAWTRRHGNTGASSGAGNAPPPVPAPRARPAALRTLPAAGCTVPGSPNWLNTNSGVIAGAREVPIGCITRRTLLCAVRLAGRCCPCRARSSAWRTARMHPVDPGTGQIGQAARLTSLASHVVSKRPIWLVDAARRSSPVRSTTARIADHGQDVRHRSHPRSRRCGRTRTGAIVPVSRCRVFLPRRRHSDSAAPARSERPSASSNFGMLRKPASEAYWPRRIPASASGRNRPAETHHPIHPLGVPSARALVDDNMLIFMPDSALLYKEIRIHPGNPGGNVGRLGHRSTGPTRRVCWRARSPLRVTPAEDAAPLERLPPASEVSQHLLLARSALSAAARTAKLPVLRRNSSLALNLYAARFGSSACSRRHRGGGAGDHR